MKIAFSLIAIFLFTITSSAQSRTISKNEYEKVFEFAVEKTNAVYPVIFKVTTDFIVKGKRIRTVTDLAENESLLKRQIKRTILADGLKTNSYQVSAESGEVFCSDDGVSWKPSEPAKSECFGPVSIYGPRDIESIKYSVTVKRVKGKRIKVYRKYSVFPPWEWSKSKKKEFRETVSTIDSRGFFRTVVDIEGTLAPRTVMLINKQSWVTKAKIRAIVSPLGSRRPNNGIQRSASGKLL